MVFGDETGLLLFAGALVYFGIFWRIGIFVTDNWTIANTLVAIADGHLFVEETTYGPVGIETPGYRVVGGRYYGRNYGQLFLALPALFLLESLARIADIRIAIAGAWSLLLLAFSLRLGTAFGQRRHFAVLGSLVALLAFGLNTAFALPLDPRWHGLMALQITNMASAAMIGVISYRLLSAIYDQRTGIFVGAATVLATPVAFWASIPKRHIVVSMLAVVTLYAFYRSRAAGSETTALRMRCIAYACLGLWAWVHAPEALAMFVVLVPFDVATARSNTWRRLAVVGGVFLTSLVPFFLTNWIISGNPLKPPRLLARSGAGIGGGSGAGIGGGGPTGGESQTVATEPVTSIVGQVSSVVAPFKSLSNLFLDGLEVVVGEPGRVLHTFVRSAPATTRATATDLTLLETAPLFGALVAVPLVLLLKRRGERRLASLSPPRRQTDLFALAFVLAFTLLYMERLPLHAMWTVRYLLPIVPFGMYFVGRLGPVRRIVADQARLLVYGYAGLVLVGGQLLVVLLVAFDPTMGEVIQIHGILGIVAAAVVGLWTIVEVLDIHDDARIGAISLAVPLAVGTLFVLLTGMEYFVVGHFGLYMTELLSDGIPIL